MCMSQDLNCPHQYLNVMGIFSYDANDKRWLQERKNEARLVRVPEKANMVLFPGARNLSVSVITIGSCINVFLHFKQGLSHGDCNS